MPPTTASIPKTPAHTPKITHQFGVCVGVLGILAVVGGIFAIRRKRFGLSLAGAICALPLYALGVPAVIFICLSKKEFGEERKEDDI